MNYQNTLNSFNASKPDKTFWIDMHQVFNGSSAILWGLAYVVLLYSVLKNKSAKGVSLQSLFALCISETLNMILKVIFAIKFSIIPPLSYYFFDLPITVCAWGSWYIIKSYYYDSYEKANDSFGERFLRVINVEFGKKYYSLFIYLVAALFALILVLLRRSRIDFWVSFLECFDDGIIMVALLPQLFMFYSRRPKKVTKSLGNFIILMFLSRLLAFIFWVTFPLFSNNPIPGRGLHILSDLFNLAILSDFIYFYIKAFINKDQEIDLPI